MASSLLKPSLFYLMALPLCASANTSDPWQSEVELGFQALSGNSDSMTINSRLGVNYTEGRYRHSSDAKFLLVEKGGVEDKRKSEFESQANYKFDPTRYIWGNVSFLDDKYGPYFKDLTMAAGLGYQAIWQEDLSLLLEIGPGYRYQTPNLDKIKSTDLILPYDVKEAILRGQAELSWQMTKSALFEGRITAISGPSNTSFEARVSVSTSLIDDLAIKLSTTKKYISEVPPGLKNLDSIFTVNMLYKF
ncbi:DUF481 domain-containing protein [Grimontia hollisae]|uniref:Salt-induced outer membrane protein n=2 Tax=Grimontia hollisae TaxID=673 RepID=D0I8P8_GRIHO|nr:DUF481 domain-containing protein [Grimontia hollisae]AMG30881.1 DUF481 domain-containing protein [Grimontia hollisae]EEY73017.1 hypothetical protein VHA_002123 [Grimontia hollisae CIP 101886]MDF2183204.1 DUF481 domain-containing protein [Grimontia hollisae]STO47200.1 Putative salt-induced outer membrane protein [Grimontia hollisae]STO56054.1 Putative salt-induced outer membrane protein [Grimontia hollisae]